MPRSLSIHMALVCAATMSIACEKCAPGKVGTGVSRLTMRNVGAMIEAVSRDTSCGFESLGVRSNPRIDGKTGSEGTITYRVEECYLEYTTDDPFISEDCNGAVTAAAGKILITAEKSIGGMLTGDPNRPVIPGGPDAATITIERAQFEEFVVQKSTSTKFLTMKSGAISAVMTPRLAVAASSGVCAIPTKHVGFDSVIYEPSLVRVTTDARDFEVDVDGSYLAAAHGPYFDKENELWGEISVWGSQQTVPNDDDGLDPDYDPDQFVTSYACAEDLQAPVSFTCSDTIGPRLASAASRLTIRSFGRIAKLVEKNAECGFSSPTVAGAASIVGDVGSIGSAVFTVSECAIDLPAETVILSDCTGIETAASGRVVVSGTKTLTGRLTGDPASPVVPMSDSPAEIELVMAPDRFAVTEDGKTFEIVSGRLSGKLVPRVAGDTSQSGACAFPTAIARFFRVRYEDPAEVVIRTDSGSFVTTIEDSDLEALNGTWNNHSNLLDGNITVAGERFLLPVTPEDTGLDPEFEQAAFDASWQCGETLEMPVRHACDFTAPLAQGAAQLTIQTIGKLAKLLDSDETCGFSSPAVALNPSIGGDLGYPGGAGVWTVATPCQFTLPDRTELETDCNGKKTYASGSVSLSGTKTIAGINSGHPETPIIPTTRDPATLTVTATFDDFALWADPEMNKLHIKSGSLTGTVKPRVAQDVTTGACSISTPVAQFEDIEWQSADVVVVKGDKQFRLQLDGSALRAQNGNNGAVTNSLSGSIEVDGASFAIPIAGPAVLDPDYDQATFDASYACIPDMRVPAKEEDCNMKSVIGHGVARLLVLTAGAIAGRINANDDCGFENFWVKTNPSNVVGDSGDMGHLEWNIEGCEIDRTGSMQPYETDCLLRDKFIDGKFTVDAHRTVRGLRETQFLIFDSIVPVAHDSVDLSLQAVLLEDFSTWEIDAGAFEVTRGISIPRGTLSAVVHPITGERADDPGTYDVSTPVAHFSQIQLSASQATIQAEGKTFSVYINDADIQAFHGSYASMGMTNHLGGTISIDGFEVALGGGLDPIYEQAGFDARYACNPDLAYLIPPSP